MVAQFFTKYAAEILDYQIDWTLPLNGDTIATVTVTTSDFTQPIAASKDATSKIATFWVAGGIAGAQGKVLCTITTVGGRTMQAEAFVTILSL